MTNPVTEHEAIQPPAQSIKKWPNSYKSCPGCDGLMAKHAQLCRECRFARPQIEQPADTNIRYIALTRGLLAIVDVSKYAWLNKWRWYAIESDTGKFYAVRNDYTGGSHVRVAMHRLIMGIVDPLIQVDHKNTEETLDNRVENIRDSTASQNGANRSDRHAVSGFKGVHILPARPGRRKTDRWRAGITVRRRFIGLGIYHDPMPAARAYDIAAIRYFGEYANLNFPEDRARYEEEIQRSYPPMPPPDEQAC